MSQMYDAIKPGGYAVLAEIGGDVQCDDGTMKEDNLVKQFFDNISKALKIAGRHGLIRVEDLKDRLERGGFVDIEVKQYKIPLAPWPKEKRLKQVGALVSFLQLHAGPFLANRG